MEDSLDSPRTSKLLYYPILQVISCPTVQSRVTRGERLAEVVCQQLLSVKVERWEVSLEEYDLHPSD